MKVTMIDEKGKFEVKVKDHEAFLTRINPYRIRVELDGKVIGYSKTIKGCCDIIEQKLEEIHLNLQQLTSS